MRRPARWTCSARPCSWARTNTKGPLVWLDLDQQALDDAYDQQVYAPNRDQVGKRRIANSDKVRAIMADTHSLGFNRVTAGSRATFASGMIIVDSARKAITELRELTASLRRFSDTLERNPGMLLQGRPNLPPGPGE